MKFSFKKIFENLLKEVDVKEIGIFPGKFKPPHTGHFSTCLKASKENKMVLVLISSKEHEGITAERSLEIWNIYKKYIANIVPFICSPTPVLGCLEAANILNNGEYKPSPLSSSPKSNIQELFNSSPEMTSFINVGNNIELNLYASNEDISRFKSILKEPYTGKNVMSIKFKPVDRITSASKFRDALKTKKNILNFIPKELSEEDRQRVINILNVNV
jgi:hypothetical protein